MRPSGIGTAKMLSHDTRSTATWLLLGLVILVLCLAMTTPFVYETRSLLTKAGPARSLYRTGQVLGIVAALLVCLQIILALRVSSLERVLGLQNLMILHRLTGMVIVPLGLVHAVLILFPNGWGRLQVDWRQWPVLLGAGLLLLVVLMAATSIFRQRLDVRYDLWRRLHKTAGYVVYAGIFIHLLNVSESYLKPLPRFSAYVIAGCVLLLVVWRKVVWLWSVRNSGSVTGVEQIHGDVTAVRVEVPEKMRFNYAPGQFAFLSFKEGISSEPHPFSIASPPEDGNHLEFFIKANGDWSEEIGRLQVGARVHVEGPYGIFTPLVLEEQEELLLVGGGIGITPLLSMLRYLADHPGQWQRVMLIWSTGSESKPFLEKELELLQLRLPILTVHHVFTRGRYGARRIDKDMLQTLLADVNRSAVVYICGPIPMMQRVAADCRSLGFADRRIFRERFQL